MSYPNLTPAKVFVFKSMFSEEELIERQKSHEMLTDTESAAKMRKSLDVPENEGTWSSELFPALCCHLQILIRCWNESV